MEQQSVEVWKNTARGPRWYVSYDRLGHEVTRTVRGEGTFTIPVFDRQMNQERAATPNLDAFRNGTFVLVRGAKETNVDEISSPDALTDNEILSIVHEVMAGNTSIQAAVHGLSSPITLGRVHEQLVVENGRLEDIEFVKEKRDEMEGGVTVQRGKVVSTKPVDRMPKVKQAEDDLVTEEKASPGREIKAERVK